MIKCEHCGGGDCQLEHITDWGDEVELEYRCAECGLLFSVFEYKPSED